MIEIRGWIRTSLIDYPGHIATVLFFGGCNFACPMCHNPDLVQHPGLLPGIDPAEVLDYLSRRQGKVTGVVITGGEPTLQRDLSVFLEAVQHRGCAVKLDTNGYRPDALEELLTAGLVDRVAMDIKGPPAKYGVVAGVEDPDLKAIEASLAMLTARSVVGELRTTVVPLLLDADDIEAVARWLSDSLVKGSLPYTLQQFRGAETLDPALTNLAPYPPELLRKMAMRARQWLPDVRLRGCAE